MLRIFDNISRFLFFSMVLIVFMMPSVYGLSTEPTVIITGYKISPDVILPNEVGTIEVTIANTAMQASKTATESVGSDEDPFAQSITVPVNAFIESATLKTTDFTVLSGWYQDIG